MKFYSAEDIERMAAEGQRELILDDNCALTDLARDTARQLGIKLTYGPGSALTPSRPPAASSEPRSTSESLPAKPKGCQHGPLTGAQPGQAPSSGGSTPLVDRLVGMVKQIGGRSGN